MSNGSTFGFSADDVSVAILPDTEIPPELDGAFTFDEPTGGVFPPRITPGPVRFRFEVTKFEEQDNPAKPSLHVLRNGKVPKLEYTAHVQVADLGLGRLLRDTGESEIAVRFNEASGYKSAAMVEKHVATDLERLFTSLGLLAEFGKPKSLDSLVEMLRNCGSRFGTGSLGWSAAVKLSAGVYEVFSTKPNAKRGEKPWPGRDAKGALLTEITFSNGETRLAREGIVALYTPKAAK